MAFFTLLTWPIRWIFQTIRSRRAMAHARVQHVVILGLDGQDPELTDQFMAEGLLPNFKKLQEQGCYKRLQTSLPAESPVAWSCFQTGCNPGKHKIFDFLVPNRKSYLPELCSAQIGDALRSVRIGKYRIPIGKPQLTFGRKSQSFWTILGEHGVFSNILRVPISFPPERFRGVMLGAMSIPDLKGTQGTFTYFTNDAKDKARFTGGQQVTVQAAGGKIKTYIPGPMNSLLIEPVEMRIPIEIELPTSGRAHCVLKMGKEKFDLPMRDYTPWINLTFKAGLGIKVRGIVRFYLMEQDKHFKLYMTPINIDPETPALPISHPFPFSMYLSKTQGAFATLGLAEDTWALNERVIDEEAFLKQAYLIHEERERMFFDALDKTKRGAVVCVFDITDRLQHMFFRYLEKDHPANPGKDMDRHKDAVRELYTRMDDLVGRTMAAVGEDTLLFVMSDHGFKPFRRGINLNTWLYQNGYLVLKGDKPTGSEWLADVDWSKTRAYAIGLGGIYLNVKGREIHGIVEPGEAEKALREEIRAKLRELHDDEKGTRAINEVWDCKVVYQGPYVREAPDLFVGFAPGYRASWDCATGVVGDAAITDNTKSWSGDHCMNPPDVPGILFCNRKYDKEQPSIMDLGPTTMDLFGVSVPTWCDGESLMPRLEEAKS